jgi:predicted transport protein
MIEQNRSDLNVVKKKGKRNSDDYWFADRSIINVALSNKNITPEVIKLLIHYFPLLVKTEDPRDECMPLHVLCTNSNENLDENSAIAILEILVTAYPKAMKLRGRGHTVWFMSNNSALGKRANQMAENNMSFKFNKALLAQYSRFTKTHKLNVLQLACRFGSSLDMIKKLVEDNTDLLLLEDGNKNVALHKAVRYATPEVVGYLVTAEQMALTKHNKWMEVPLHTACTAGRCRAVKYLVERNRESLLLQDKDKEVALHMACRKGTLQTIRYIMEKNMAAVQIRNQNNELPVHVLCNRLNEVGNNIKDVAGIEIVFRLLRAYPETMIV